MRIGRRAGGGLVDPRSVTIGLLAGLLLMTMLRAGAQPAVPPQNGGAQPPVPGQPAPGPAQAEVPAAQRFQISAGDPARIFVLDHQTNSIYLFVSGSQGVWQPDPEFGVFNLPDQIQLLEKRRQQQAR